MSCAEHDSSDINRALEEAERSLGGRGEFAKQLEVSPSAIGNWRARGVPIKACVRIEQLVPAVTRRRLRPHDWATIWPELAHPEHCCSGGAEGKGPRCAA